MTPAELISLISLTSRVGYAQTEAQLDFLLSQKKYSNGAKEIIEADYRSTLAQFNAIITAADEASGDPDAFAAALKNICDGK